MSQGGLKPFLPHLYEEDNSFQVVGFPADEVQSTLSDADAAVILDYGRDILQQEGNALLTQMDRLNEDFSKAVGFLLKCRGKVVVSGIGKAGLIGQKIVATFSSTGTPSHFLHPAEAAHGDLGVVSQKDVLLILSHSGETEEVVRLLPSLRRLGVPIISITSSPWNTLGRFSHAIISMGNITEAGSLNLAPSTSTSIMLAIGDALALSTSRLRGFRDEDFARLHPGGSLGRKLSCVNDYMRPISQCRICSDQKSIREIFVESRLPGRRSGAILLIDIDGRLSGIFTDSDLARIFERRDFDLLERPVDEMMTRLPKVVVSGSRMQDAVALMGEKKISELPVIDDAGSPIGILDITDLVAFFPERKTPEIF